MSAVAGVIGRRYTGAGATHVVGTDEFLQAAFSGMLIGVVVDGGTLGAITIYDNTAGSGTIIASWTPPVGTAGANTNFYGRRIITGLTIVRGAATDISVYFTCDGFQA